MKLNNTSDKVELVTSEDPWYKKNCKKKCEEEKKSPIKKRRRLSDNCKCTSNKNKSSVFSIVYNLFFIMLSILLSIVILKQKKFFKLRK